MASGSEIKRILSSVLVHVVYGDCFSVDRYVGMWSTREQHVRKIRQPWTDRNRESLPTGVLFVHAAATLGVIITDDIATVLE